MHKTGTRTLMVLVLAVLLALPMAAATATAPCRGGIKGDARTALGRADLWRNAVVSFKTGHTNLTADQARFLEEATKFSDALAQQPEDTAGQLAFIRKAERMVARSRELFTLRELGELYSAMGPMQSWLAETVAATPFCNCYSSPCTLGSGGSPTGNCVAGCLSWDDNGGTRYTGLCSSAAAAD